MSTVTGVRGGRARETQNCRHFWTRLVSSRLKSVSHRDRGGRAVTGIRGVVLAKPRTVVTFGLASRLRVSKVYKKCQQSQGSGGGRARETQNCRHFWTTGIGWVVLAKPRTVVTFGLVSSLRVSKVYKKVSTVTGIGEVVLAKPRTVVTFALCVSKVYKSVNSHRDRGGRARETQNCRHFWTRLVSSRLKSV